MKNKEFLAQFSRHLIRTAANLEFEPKIEMLSVPITPVVTARTAFESEKKEAEEMMRIKPQIQQQPAIIPPIDISRIADRQFAIPAPKISPQEMSLRRELETAKQHVMKSIPIVRPQMMMRPMPAAVKPQTFVPKTPEVQAEETPSFNLEKLNIFLKNPDITSIECNGPESVVIIKKGTVPISTTTVLSKDEINNILHKFSVATKTEITPIYKASYENLGITAFVSPLIGTRFVLTKTK